MQIPPSEVAAPHLAFLEELGVLHRCCEADNWPLDQHPIDIYVGGYLGHSHGENPRHCDGDGDFYWASKKHWEKTGDVPHECKHIKREWGIDEDGVMRYIEEEISSLIEEET